MYKPESDIGEQRPNLDAIDAGTVVRSASGPAPRPIEYLFGAADPIPEPTPELLEPDISYERGSIVYALDGPVGTLRQVVIDEDVAEVRALVIRMSAKYESVLMPPELVDKCVGKTLLLNVTKEQFAKGASRSPRFDARMFTGADAKTVSAVIPLAFRGNKQRSLVSISDASVQTSEVFEPAPASQAPAASRRWWQRFGRS